MSKIQEKEEIWNTDSCLSCSLQGRYQRSMLEDFDIIMIQMHCVVNPGT